VNDAVRLFLCLGDDPISFLLDALALFDLLRDGRSHLIDDIEQVILVDDQVRTERHPKAVAEQALQTIN